MGMEVWGSEVSWEHSKFEMPVFTQQRCQGGKLLSEEKLIL